MQYKSPNIWQRINWFNPQCVKNWQSGLTIRAGFLFLQFVKSFSAYISGVLSLIMIAAIMLPSLHAFEHDAAMQKNDLTHTDSKITKNAFDCDLCDFNFSTLTTPVFINYDLYLPFEEDVYSISIAQTIFLYYKSSFSLRAPPSVIA